MAMKIPPALGKLLYAGLFLLLLPAALVGWTYGARVNVSLPGIESVPWGASVAFAGLMLWAAGVLTLWVEGGGLPMNAFPPPRLVTKGVYSITAHPIYVGFTLAAFGTAVGCGSAAAQWLVSPMLALAAGSLWWGYERIDLRARLGAPPRDAWIGVPSISTAAPCLLERLGVLILTLAAPALAALTLHGSGLAGRSSYLIAESSFRVWITLALVAAGVFTTRTCTDLRDIILSSWVGSLLLAFFAMILPRGPFGGRLLLAPDGALLTVLAMTGLAALLRACSKMGTRPGVLSMNARLDGLAGKTLSLVAGLFLLGRGALPSAESLLGATAFVLASARWHCWRAALGLCERIANCWRESDFGAVRIIHIGWFAALPACGGAAAAVVLLGPGAAAMTVWAFVFIIIGSALWAQLIEGSPALSRPYGFFGGVLAVIVFAVAIAPLIFDTSPWLVLGTFATAAPWAQGLARLRCIANGCCHGAPCSSSCGVIYRNPRTRPVRLANLGGVPLHPTQLYSLTGNLFIGALMMRLWAEGVSLSFITGLYFALMGLARFVEEAWRGEPQTPAWAGLRLYQWVSIASFLGGAALTVLPDAPHAPAPVPSLAAIWTGLAVGALTWIVVSVEFPRSSRRFARLA
ncbi:MAG TPA: prolipoprotein diacylglyceryl transferase family protein [Acidobacteriota bacterium]|nr:prolipoprotein diacylglyceryl transferase family protein [Acidobacteriota bacterium]